MKYVGSKRWMLQNGLGELLKQEIPSAARFVDLFAGSAAVATHVAQHFAIPVVACDLQAYSVVLANAVITRQRKLKSAKIWAAWHKRAEFRVRQIGRLPIIPKILTRALVTQIRTWCANQSGWPITVAYGGHYFSPEQTVWIDALRATLPRSSSAKNVALAALIQTVSQCAAAPGHTAQPFQPTRTAMPFLQHAWSIEIASRTEQAFVAVSLLVAKKPGRALRADANEIAKRVRKDDLVFVDPPYSGVHYSRFYHVLESVARGECGEVSGIGRYPPTENRPRSRYSLKSDSAVALDQLLQTIALRGAKAILTFPDHECSNGLSGRAVREIAARYFQIREQTVASRFSTLGGTSDNRGDEAGRAARRRANELMLILK